MSLPSLEKYQEAFQQPLATLFDDPTLKIGNVQTTGMGMPLVRSGNFALTYEVSAAGRKYAVRCFHRDSADLTKRYGAISRKISELKSPYFIDFDYYPDGIRIEGKRFPLVKMGWSQGDALSEFIFKNYNDSERIAKLRKSLQHLSTYLEANSIAHGDIQLGNIMVARDGDQVQLIDYDGMYVPEIGALGSSELGHRNFQHPLRRPTHFDSKLDRFSFISLDLALKAVEADPSLYDKTKSDEDGVVFKANDFADPSGSDAFKLVSAVTSLEKDAKGLAAICIGEFEQIPTLHQFTTGLYTPASLIPLKGSAGQPTSQKLRYISSYSVIDAANYTLCVTQVGNRVELIGKVLSVKTGLTRNGRGGKRGKPYIHIDFVSSQGGTSSQKVRIVIWSEGIDKLRAARSLPDASWQGSWLTVTGVFDNIYNSRQFGYSSVSITVDGAGQMRQLSEVEAQYRLGAAGTAPQRRNEALVGKGGSTHATRPSAATGGTVLSKNQQVLQAMQATSPIANSTLSRSPTTTPGPVPAAKTGGGIPFYVWIFGAIILFVILSTLR